MSKKQEDEYSMMFKKPYKSMNSKNRIRAGTMSSISGYDFQQSENQGADSSLLNDDSRSAISCAEIPETYRCLD
jgi:hypothetical protein